MRPPRASATASRCYHTTADRSLCTFAQVTITTGVCNNVPIDFLFQQISRFMIPQGKHRFYLCLSQYLPLRSVHVDIHPSCSQYPFRITIYDCIYGKIKLTITLKHTRACIHTHSLVNKGASCKITALSLFCVVSTVLTCRCPILTQPSR